MQSPGGGALLSALLTLAVLLPIWWQAGQWYQMQLLAEQRAQTEVEVSLRGDALSLALNRRFDLLQGLYAFVQVESSATDLEAKFQTFAAGLCAGNEGIRAVALAPGGIVRYVYPLAGNERLVGYDPINDPSSSMRADTQRAIQTRQLILSRSYEPTQDDLSLVVWQAIYQDSAYWGLISAVLDIPPLLDVAGLSVQPGGLVVALRDGLGSVFYSSGDVSGRDPVIYRIELPGGVWELVGVPEEGWQAAIRKPLLIFQAAGLIIAGSLAGLVYLSINRHARLSLAVRQRTREISQVNAQLQADIAERQRVEAALREREEQYRSVFESTTDGLFIYDLEGRLVDFNPAACRMHGYPPEEFRHMQPAQFIHPDSLPLFAELIETVKAGGQFRCRMIALCHDGTPFHAEVIGASFAYRDQPHALAVLRDVTEQVQAYQLLEQRVKERTREIERRRQVAEGLRDVLAALNSNRTLNETLDYIVAQASRVLDADGAAIYLLQSTQGVLRVQAARGLDADYVATIEIPVGWGGVGRAVLKRQPVILPDPSAAHPAKDDAPGLPAQVSDVLMHFAERYHAVLAVPLIVKDQVCGGLSFYCYEPHSFSDEEVRLAAAFGDQAALAVENARLRAQAEQAAIIAERHRLARELHDSVTQLLYSLTLFTEASRQQVGRGSLERVEHHLVQIGETAQQALKEMRLLVYELRPSVLEQEGLVGALNQRLESVERRAGIEAHLLAENLTKLSAPVEEELYRIAQEALNNALKHAAANLVTVHLRPEGEEIDLEIADNGKGFNLEQAGESGGMGLTGMRERVEKLGGSLTIVSTPGQGTKVKVVVPASWEVPR